MPKVLALGFTRSGCLLKRAVFEKLFPASRLACADEWYTGQVDADGVDVVLVNAAESEYLALEAMRREAGQGRRVLLYAERLPSLPFVLVAQEEEKVSLFFAPESLAELSSCAESLSRGQRFSLRVDADRAVLRYLHFEKLTLQTRLLLFAQYAGLSLKETASLCGTSEH